MNQCTYSSREFNKKAYYCKQWWRQRKIFIGFFTTRRSSLLSVLQTYCEIKYVGTGLSNELENYALFFSLLFFSLFSFQVKVTHFFFPPNHDSSIPSCLPIVKFFFYEYFLFTHKYILTARKRSLICLHKIDWSYFLKNKNIVHFISFS